VPYLGSAPDHAPEALHDVALVEDQVSVEEVPLVTDEGFAEIDTVGAGGGGGGGGGAGKTTVDSTT
jgi:hypothetical protein